MLYITQIRPVDTSLKMLLVLFYYFLCLHSQLSHGCFKGEKIKMYTTCEDPRDCCTENRPCGNERGDCDTDKECQEGLVCGTNNCRDIDPKSDKWWDCCAKPKQGQLDDPENKNFFYLRNKAYQSGGLYLATHRKHTGQMVMAGKTTYETNHRMQWYYEDGHIYNRNNSMQMMVVGDEGVMLTHEQSQDSDFIFVDMSYDDYEQIQSRKTKKVLAATGGRGNNCSMEEPSVKGVRKQQIWLREPVLACRDDEGDVHVKNCSDEVKTGDTILILKRSQSGNPVDYFNKTFKEYEEGFGDKDKEFWIGLEHLSKYTNCDCYWELNVTLTDFEGETYTGHYSRFYIDKGPEYTLTVDGFFSHAHNHKTELMMLDCLSYSNKRKFSTWDYDQDNWGHMHNHTHHGDRPDANAEDNCSRSHGWGGWWYRACSDSQLTGLNLNSANAPLFSGIFWSRWKDVHAGRFSWPEATLSMTLEI